MRHLFVLLVALCTLVVFHVQKLLKRDTLINTIQTQKRLDQMSLYIMPYSPYASLRRLIYYWIYWNSVIIYPTYSTWNVQSWTFWLTQWRKELEANNKVTF